MPHAAVFNRKTFTDILGRCSVLSLFGLMLTRNNVPAALLTMEHTTMVVVSVLHAKTGPPAHGLRTRTAGVWLS